MDITASAILPPRAAQSPVAAAPQPAAPQAVARAEPSPARQAIGPSPLSETQRGVTEGKARKLGELSQEEQAVVDQLKARDREVRDHEQAHARVGGPYAGEPSYTYQTGPDGQRYAVGGEVAIDIAPVDGDPEATIQKMEVVKAAALAPAEPSSQDRKVAALAEAQRMQAIADLAELRRAVNEAPEDPVLDMVA